MIVAVLLISFILEGIVSNLVPTSSLFIPLFSIVSLLVTYPLFNENKIKYLIYSGTLGLLYDLVYTSTPFINTFTFVITALIITFICKFITLNKLNLVLIILFILLFNQTINYLLLCLFRYRIFNNATLLEGLYSSLILNVVYSYILYVVIEIINKKRKYKRIIWIDVVGLI